MLASALFLAAPAWGQLQFFVVTDTSEKPAPSLYDLGSVYANETATARFRIRNTSAAPAAVTTLAVAGAGFSLTAPSLPVTLAPQAALDFSVGFRAADIGSYSAALRSDGISILLTATVLSRLTLIGSFDFGNLTRGSSMQHRFTVVNETPQVLTVPAIAVQGADFALVGATPSGQSLQPLQSADFTVVFTPTGTGARQGTLVFGDRSYALTGIGSDPPLPRPSLSIDLKQAASAQQGLAIVKFDAPAQTSGTGVVTLDFRGANDPTVAFASGGRTASFQVAPGDTQASVAFQTGTTAGTLTFTAQVGSASSTASVAIPGAPVGVSATAGVRSTSNVEVRITGFDNTRTIGALSFAFFDAAGNALTASAIQTDASGDFAKYFAGTDLGGTFLLRAVFPVTGDASRIASCDVTLANSTGSSKAPRVLF
jgi:hypothetical protein